jgi:hypothetical protein
MSRPFAALIANEVNQPITLECNHRRIDRGAPNQLWVGPALGDMEMISRGEREASCQESPYKPKYRAPATNGAFKSIYVRWSGRFDQINVKTLGIRGRLGMSKSMLLHG